MRNNLSSKISFTRIPEYLYRTDDVLELSRVSRMEKIPTAVFETAREGAHTVAQRIAERIREKQRDNKSMVLSLVSGQTMKDVFEELVRMHTEEKLSFRNVILFNLFEYYPLPTIDAACFGQIHEQFISRVDIPRENIYTFDASKEQKDLMSMIAHLDQRMQELGGVDLQLLGIGRNGNIGFNEPGSPMQSATRLVVLDNNSKEEAKSIFGTVEQVPPLAITMGMGTILQAKEILLCAWGEHKAQQIKTAIEGPVDTACPASALQMHANAHIYCDLGAATLLTRIHHPLLVTSGQWDTSLTRRAIV
jgi:glucosamine-6-phosphate deaminase